MPRTTTSLTTAWVLIATGPVLVTLKETIRAGVHFNETASEDTKYSMRAYAGDAFEQLKDVDTYARVDIGTCEVILETN